MIRKTWKSLLAVAVVAIALSSAVSQADAHWWGCRGPCGWGCYGPCVAPLYTPCCSPCYSRCATPCYTPCYRPVAPCYATPCYATPCCTTPAPAITTTCGYEGGYYLGLRPGPIRRLFFGPYRWYWGGNCWGGCGTYTDVTVTSDCGCNGKSAPTQTPSPAPAPTPAQKDATPVSPAPAPTIKTTATSAEQSGTLTVWVPYDAKVTINGQETRSTGSRRQFMSYDLTPGLSYRYVVKATVVRNGQVVEDTKTVTMTAGDVTAVAFGFNANPSEQFASR